MLNLTSSIENLPKAQKPQIAALKKLGIKTVKDLLFYFPYRYLDFSKITTIKNVKPEENISLKVAIKEIISRFSFKSRMSLAEAVVSDNTGSMKIIWFNQPYLAKTLKSGDEIFLAGKPEYYKNSLQLVNPIYEKVTDFPIHTGRLVPVYHLTQKIYPKTFRSFVASALPFVNEVNDVLPAEIKKNQNLLSTQSAIKFAHFPESQEQIEKTNKRMAFEEIFYNQLAAQSFKLKLAQKQAFQIKFNQELIKSFADSLPFKLTPDQKKAAWEILQDLEKPAPMNRLLEGDVGSGKTLVALIAALQAMDSGLQVAFLAPTEILAKQHFETAKKYLKAISYKLSLLTNNFAITDDKKIKKDNLHKLITDGMPGIYFGTHALIQKKVKFKNLALVIIDEQHRFGVEQRAHLIKTDGKAPHLLSLTATPIPRTLQLAFYGELNISQIKAKPLGRKFIITKLVDNANRAKAYDFIKKQISGDRQVFVITPLIEESDKLGVKSAKKEAEILKKIFPQFQIGLMHGRLKGKEKENAMNDFLENKTQILVSTSVVEVGVDVPNASVIVIEGAERFGLAQLHQFRGRVGRAEHQSYCFLFTDKSDEETLNYMALIQPARAEAKRILQNDIDLKNYPQLKEKIKDKIIHFE
ncbi:MAG: ATP-dependent DNA helicase RecG [Candidatus Doudnabacteria bacterium]|nr:ATP-dependent DNA helicase RecG [Candidatus Doudnabacteria bacterium]